MCYNDSILCRNSVSWQTTFIPLSDLILIRQNSNQTVTKLKKLKSDTRITTRDILWSLKSLQWWYNMQPSRHKWFTFQCVICYSACPLFFRHVANNVFCGLQLQWQFFKHLIIILFMPVLHSCNFQLLVYLSFNTEASLPYFRTAHAMMLRILIFFVSFNICLPKCILILSFILL